MANYVSVATGNWSTATNWNTILNTPSYHASTNITVNTTGVNSETMTAPNTTNAATGVIIHLVSKGSGGNLTATLQEDISGTGSWLDTAATVTISAASLPSPIVNIYGPIYLSFGTPYVFATTGANRYRVQLKTNTSTLTVAADSSGTKPACFLSEDITAAPGASDTVWIMGNNCANITTIHVDGTITSAYGTDATTTTSVAGRTIGFGCYIGDRGVMDFDTTANTKLVSKGIICVCNNGKVDFDNGATYEARISFGSTKFGLLTTYDGRISGHDVIRKSHTTYTSGDGTTATPLVVADATGWAVNDELIIGATSDNATNYNESENKYIKTILGTSITLSNTAGGAESGLTYTHTTSAIVANLTRNAIITVETPASMVWNFNNLSLAYGNVDLSGIRMEHFGTSNCVLSTGNVAGSSSLCYATSAVFYKTDRWGVAISGANNTPVTFTDCINAFDKSGVGLGQGGGGITVEKPNTTLNNCLAINNQGQGYQISSVNVVLNDCKAISCGISAASFLSGIGIRGGSSHVFNNCEVHACRGAGFATLTSYSLTLNSCLFGTKGKNQTRDIDVSNFGTTSYLVKILFDNCLFGSTTLISGYSYLYDGSSISFHRYNQTANNHRWYTKDGIGQSTGTGLSDTNVRTAGSLALRVAPENATDGFGWEYYIYAEASSQVTATGFVQKNAAFGTDVVKVDLFLPGNLTTTPDDTYLMPDNTDWNPFVVSANYTGAQNLYARVLITGITSTASAYFYVDDLYNGSNKIIALDVWNGGQPSLIMFEQLGDASAVWQVATSGLTIAGTTGKTLVDTKDIASDNQGLILSG